MVHNCVKVQMVPDEWGDEGTGQMGTVYVLVAENSGEHALTAVLSLGF